MDTQPNDGNADQRCPKTSLPDVRIRLSALCTKMAVLQEWLVALRREAAPLALQVALEDERALRGHAREARTKKIVEGIPVVQAQTPVVQPAAPSLSGRWNISPVVAEIVSPRLVFSKPLPEDRSRGQWNPKVCKECGESFVPVANAQQYCAGCRVGRRAS